jgi:hypothetical protein
VAEGCDTLLLVLAKSFQSMFSTCISNLGLPRPPPHCRIQILRLREIRRRNLASAVTRRDGLTDHSFLELVQVLFVSAGGLHV